MMNWTKEEHVEIENVDYEVFILGVKWPVFAWMVFAGIFFSQFGFIFLFLGPIFIWLVARKYYAAQRENKSMEYENKLLIKIIRTPVFVPLFRVAANIKNPERNYR